MTHAPAGLVSKHEFAVPADTVPLGHVVAIVNFGLSMAIYPVGHDVDGAAAYIVHGANVSKNKKINSIVLLRGITN